MFYAKFTPTVLKNGTPVQVFAITTTNVRRVSVGYPGYTVALSRIAPSRWQGEFNFNASGLSAAGSPQQLMLSAFKADGNAATIQIPVSLIP